MYSFFLDSINHVWHLQWKYFSLGRGGKKGAMEKCAKCHGTGMQTHVQQLGPGMVQRIQTVCGSCSGQGEYINPKDRCKNCHGKKVVRERKLIEVHIDKGILI